MDQEFAEILKAGGKTNSLGRAIEVIELVLADRQRLEELYECLFDDDAWVRMRAADALEKICRQHPGWLQPYIDRLQQDFSTHSQASIQWHLAQVYRQVELTPRQKQLATDWLKQLVSTREVDWIVSANAMTTLLGFTLDGSFPRADMLELLSIQQGHKSPAVRRRADKLLAQLQAATPR